MRMRCSKLLTENGYEVVEAENGLDAIAKYKESKPDAVLLDITMPEMDGLTASLEIRAQETRERRDRTPIIALTANVMSHQLLDYTAAGMDGHIA
ncbi:MAG TPA: response regulator, partial [Chloroflexota bacterium]|nr:response regulator [Chloroflexota bacterium]